MSKEKSADLIEIRDMLNKEVGKFQNVGKVLNQTSEGFNKVDQNYSKYENEIDESKKHINELRKKEFYENLFVYIGFGFFFCCVAWVILKRFPIHQIVFFIYSCLEYVFGILVASTQKIVELFSSKNVANMTNVVNPVVNRTDVIGNRTNVVGNRTNVVGERTNVVTNKTKGLNIGNRTNAIN
jgi:hypothetical protein